MTWTFSHCPADKFEGDDGCMGCPALPKPDGTASADHCEAIFVWTGPAQVDPPQNPTANPYRGTHPKVITLAEAQGWRCAYCTEPMPYPIRAKVQTPDSPTVDHVIPRCHGGHTTWDNEVAACAWCNTLKGDFKVEYMVEAIALFPGRTRQAHKGAHQWMIAARASDKRRAKRKAKRQAHRARRRAAAQQHVGG